LAWRRGIDGCDTTFLVHGEEPTMDEFARHLQGCRVEMPRSGEVFDLDRSASSLAPEKL
jgi:metallo-beta-lactamase family protein